MMFARLPLLLASGLLCASLIFMSHHAVGVENREDAQGLLAVAVDTQPAETHPSEPVDYQRQVRQILSAKCFKCHGPDAETREADLRLDTFAGATATESGTPAIVPGKPPESELIRRILSESDLDRMPPLDSGFTLPPAEIEILQRWISEGAEYSEHWAFLPPQRAPLPTVQHPAWGSHPIDRFVGAKLEAAGLQPSPRADRETLLRRVSFDLIGLPPTVEELEAFLQDSRPDAYAHLVDRLLSSPHYGERWGRHWLDVARYADTNGYEKDRPRSIWPWRDWVIQALNDDLPFDQFTIQQLAGDMLPEPETATLVATGFHRNTMLNEEGGIDPLEYRYYAMVDRVNTTGTIWLGMTIGCAQCHTHKYDPITHADYFALFGLLNNADEPDLILPDDAITARREQLLSEIAQREAELAQAFPPDETDEADTTVEDEATRRKRHLQRAFADWLAVLRQQVRPWETWRPVSMSTNLPRLELLPDGSILSTGDITKRDVFRLTFDLSPFSAPVTALRLEALPDERLPARGPGRAYYEGRKGDFFLSELEARRGGEELPLQAASHSFGKISIGSGSADAANVLDRDGSTGWSTATREGEPHQLVLNFVEPVAPEGELEIELLFERHFAASLGRFRISATTAPGVAQAQQIPVELEAKLVAAADIADQALAQPLRDELLREFLKSTPLLAEARKPLEDLRRLLPDYPTTMIFQERPADHPRPTQRHHRGEYLNAEEEVTPGLPALFAQGPQQPPRDRLELARWLVGAENPLVGRVTVNRHWQEFFGRGLVETSEDFGTQSSFPTHPELLDWLASAFTSTDPQDPDALHWSLKRLHRLIVTSEAYQQRSEVTPEHLQQDPLNELLSRAPRLRLNAEQIRDLALHSSGLLHPRIGGPSVYPPQTAGVYEAAYGSPKWPISTGPDRYRRSLYTFSKRTAPFAAYTVFDAPTGEICTVRRGRSNTPLQALTLLNDEMFLEAARKLASTAVTDELSPTEILSRMFQRLLTRQPSPAEIEQILAFQRSQLARLQSGELQPQAICDSDAATPELAAWVLVARVLLNLDETVTKS